MVKKHYGIRTNRYKLIHFYDDIDQWELFDLENDPQELNNLIDVPEYQNEILTLKSKLKELIIKYNDQNALRIFEGQLDVTE